MKFLAGQKIIWLKQFDFMENVSTTHVIVNLIDSIKKAIDQHKFACGFFINAFDTVGHKILLKNLWHYGIRGIDSDYFKSCLTNKSSTRISSLFTAFAFVYK